MSEVRAVSGQVTQIGQPEPHNIEAEQQLLGAILTNNDHAPRAAAILEASDFYDPVHARIYATAMNMIDRDEVADAVTVKGALAADDGLEELGGPAYLARLAVCSVAGFAVGDYARIVKDASVRRQAMAVLRDAGATLSRGEGRTGDVLGNVQAALVSLGASDTRMRPRSFLSAATEAVRQIDAAYRGEAVPGVPVPWTALARIVPTFRAGDMVVIGGRPSMGKSAISLSIATAAASAGHPVVIASLEMTPEDMALRAISEATSDAGNAVPFTSMSDGSLNEAQFRQVVNSVKAMESLPVAFLSEDFRKPGQLLSGVKAALEPMKAMTKTPLIVVDYMQLMQGQGRDLREQITDISKQMKHLARSHDAVNISVSQLSRAVEQRQDKRPILSDLRESGQVEQDADTVIFCYRDDYYLEREKPDGHDAEALAKWQDEMERVQGRLDLIVAKQRRGPIGTARLRFYPACNRVWEV